MDILQFVGSIGGITGVLAFLIFTAYRYTVRQMRDDRKYMEDRLTDLVKENFTIRERYIESLSQNTKVLTELITYLRRKNGS